MTTSGSYKKNNNIKEKNWRNYIAAKQLDLKLQELGAMWAAIDLKFA